MHWIPSRRSLIPLSMALLSGLLLAPGARGGDWPQFRGPERNGHSAETGLVRTWPESGPPELWRVASGASFSGLTVVGDRIYTMDSDGDQEYVLALDAGSGKTLWKKVVGALFTNSFGDGPRSTPTYVAAGAGGGTLYAVASRGILVALDAGNGEERWRVSFPERFGSALPNWAFTCSPLVVGDLVVVETGGTEGRAVAAFDKVSGELRWTALDEAIVYSSPILVELAGVQQLIFQTLGGLRALSVEGKLLWQSEFMPKLGIKPASPVFLAPDLIFASASYDGGAKVVRMRKLGEGIGVETVWEGRTMMRNHFNSSVAIGQRLYGFDKEIFKCIDATTGEAAWAQRGLGKGSLITADGLLVILSERGRLVLAEATPEGYRELAGHQALTGRSWTQPSLAGGRLYLRNGSEIVAFDLRAQG